MTARARTLSVVSANRGGPTDHPRRTASRRIRRSTRNCPHHWSGSNLHGGAWGYLITSPRAALTLHRPESALPRHHDGVRFTWAVPPITAHQMRSRPTFRPRHVPVRQHDHHIRRGTRRVLSANSKSSCPAEAPTDLLGNLQTHRGPASGSEQTAPGGGRRVLCLAVAPTPPLPEQVLCRRPRRAHPVRSVRAYVPATRSKSSR